MTSVVNNAREMDLHHHTKFLLSLADDADFFADVLSLLPANGDMMGA